MLVGGGKPLPFGYVLVVLSLLRPDMNFAWNKSELIVMNDLFVLALFGLLLLNVCLPFVIYEQGEIVREFLLALAIGLVFGILSSLIMPSIIKQTNSLPIMTSLAIIAKKSFGEEILYLGFLMSYLKQSGLNSGILILAQSLIFMLPHLVSYWNNPIAVLATFVFGLICGYLTL
jgi:hypothetical protein